VSALTSLAAGGEPVLALVADVARRRPLLGRDVLPPALGCRGAYLQAACRGRLEAVVEGAGVVMTGYDVALACPGVAAAFTHVVLLDPPPSAAAYTAAVAAAGQAWVHALWGPAEARFAETVQAAGPGLDQEMRRVWRALSAGPGRFDDALEQELVETDPFLRPVGVLASALRALREAGLLGVDGGGYHLERPQSKVDVTSSGSYGTWHTLFQKNDFLRTCLTARL
jgi:hypothetical protein